MIPDDLLDKIRVNFGEIIQEYVGRFTQQEIAARLGIRQATVSQWALKRTLPTLPNLLSVAIDRNQSLWQLVKELCGDAKTETRPELLERIGREIGTMSDRPPHPLDKLSGPHVHRSDRCLGSFVVYERLPKLNHGND